MALNSRRQFLTTSSIAAGALIVGRHLPSAEPAPSVTSVKRRKGSDLVTLGKTGIRSSLLGLGTGTSSGKEQRALGQEAFTRLIREAYDRGIRYVDTADSYQMHGFVKTALKELPGKDIFVQTKSMAKTAEKAKADIERLRRELDRETLDTLLIHCMTKLNWPVDMRPVIDVFIEAKQKGQVRAIGVSCHSFEALTDAVGNDLMDVHLVRVNPFGRVMDADYEKVCGQIAAMHQKNRGVIGMKIYGNVGLKSREERFQSLKAVLGLGTVDAFTIGFSKIEHIDETLELIEKATAA